MAGKVKTPRRGEVYLVNFDPTQGAKIQKTRPSLVIQNDVSNRRSAITVVAAITSRTDGRVYPTEVFVRAPEGGVRVDSLVVLNQVRSIDKSRLLKRLGSVEPETMQLVDRALEVSLGLVDLC